MFVPFHARRGPEPVRGLRRARGARLGAYRAQHPNIGRLDRILKAEGDHPDRYQLAKQADAVMLFFLFSPDELHELFDRLGYPFDPDMARRTIDYYDRRTSHGSTLSLSPTPVCWPRWTRPAPGSGFSSR